MSNGRTGNTAIPPSQAYPKEMRLQMMRQVIGLLAQHGETLGVKPKHFAATYRVSEAEVEAELMRHLQEGEGK